MKLCKNCKHLGSNGRCQKQLVIEPDYVNGTAPKIKDGWRGNAMLQREDGFFASLFINSCGKRARWFVPNMKSSQADQ